MNYIYTNQYEIVFFSLTEGLQSNRPDIYSLTFYQSGLFRYQGILPWITSLPSTSLTDPRSLLTQSPLNTWLITSGWLKTVQQEWRYIEEGDLSRHQPWQWWSLIIGVSRYLDRWHLIWCFLPLINLIRQVVRLSVWSMLLQQVRHCLDASLEDKLNLALFLLSLHSMLQSISPYFCKGVPAASARQNLCMPFLLLIESCRMDAVFQFLAKRTTPVDALSNLWTMCMFGFRKQEVSMVNRFVPTSWSPWVEYPPYLLSMMMLLFQKRSIFQIKCLALYLGIFNQTSYGRLSWGPIWQFLRQWRVSPCRNLYSGCLMMVWLESQTKKHLFLSILWTMGQATPILFRYWSSLFPASIQDIATLSKFLTLVKAWQVYLESFNIMVPKLWQTYSIILGASYGGSLKCYQHSEPRDQPKVVSWNSARYFHH